MELKLQVNNQNLAATLIKPKGYKKPLPALILIHGWKSDQTGNIKRAREISKLGLICLTIDLRGHGKSDGKLEDFSRKDHLEDIKVAYRYLSKLPEVDNNQIGIIGSSYGAYLAAAAANYLKFDRLVLRVPALYFDKNFNTPSAKLFDKDPKAFKTWNLIPANSLALKGVATFAGEILIVESEKDRVIPPQVIENYIKYIDKKNLTYKLMKNASHSLETKKQEIEYLRILISFLEMAPRVSIM